MSAASRTFAPDALDPARTLTHYHTVFARSPLLTAALFALWITLNLLAGGARAEAPGRGSQPPAGYYPAINQAFEEFKLGNYEEARARFNEAHRLFPNAQTYRALGMVEYELKKYVDAIAALSAALASQVKPLAGTVRTQTEELLASARGYVARIQVVATPKTAVVLVDGVAARRDADGLLLLQVGDHDLELVAPAHIAHKRQLKIVGGEMETLRVVLQPVTEQKAAGAQGAPKPRGESERRPLRKNPWLWSAVCVVVVGAAVGLGFGLRRMDSPDDTTHEGGSTGTALRGPR